jgi:hypothetical protein
MLSWPTSIYNLTITVLKLRPYWKDTNLLNRHRDEMSMSDGSMWADDILGLRVDKSRTHGQSLAAEVDAYLLDGQFSTNILNFWQVCGL